MEVYAGEALEKARTTDRRLREAPDALGKLFGLIFSHKDVICYRDHRVQAGSRILDGFTSLFSATAMERMEAADAIVIGRVNCDEFAMGSTNETSFFGPVRNALGDNRIPGGSSGGSAVSVQADTCLVSLGSDTGGSVRQPAAFCGIIGMKPTYGRVSRHGLLAYGSSFDQIGILAQSVDDAALTLEVIAGPDSYDGTAIPEAAPAYSRLLQPPGPSRIAYFATAIEHPSLDPEVRRQMESLVERMRQLGHTVEAVPFELIDYLIPAYYVLTTAEASSNLSRYDGIRYGHRSPVADNLLDTYRKSRTEGFGAEVKRRIMLGAFVLSAGYYDAYYQKAQQVRRLIFEHTQTLFQDYDFLLMPAAPGTAWELGDSLDDPVAMYLADIFTVQANMTGIPAIALPLGNHPNGMPIGYQLMAPAKQEDRLLAFAKDLNSSIN